MLTKHPPLSMDFRDVYLGEKQSRKSLYHGKRGTNKHQWLSTPKGNQVGHIAKSKPKREEAKEKAAARIQPACAPGEDLNDVDNSREDGVFDDEFVDFEYTAELDDAEAIEFL